MFKWFKDLINKARESSRIEETRCIQMPESSEVKVIDDLTNERANAYLALWLRSDLALEKMPQYKKVEQFICKWVIEDENLRKPLESVNLHATEEMKKFAKQFKILGYKCSDTALIEYLESIL